MFQFQQKKMLCLRILLTVFVVVANARKQFNICAIGGFVILIIHQYIIVWILKYCIVVDLCMYVSILYIRVS